MKINNDEENKAALTVVGLLMDADPEPESKEGITLKFIAEAIQEYEKKYDIK